MSQSSSTPPRQRRGGRNRNRPADHGSRDQHERQRHHRDTETFQRPKGGPKLTLWQKVLSLIGLGPKPPLRRADRPATSEPTNDAPRGGGGPPPPPPPTPPNHTPATAVASRVKPANHGNHGNRGSHAKYGNRAKPGRPAHRVSPNPRAPSCNMK